MDTTTVVALLCFWTYDDICVLVDDDSFDSIIADIIFDAPITTAAVLHGSL